MRAVFLGLAVFLAGVPAQAASKILWQPFYAEFTYRDYDFTCKTQHSVSFYNYLVVEMDKGKVMRATLRKELLFKRYENFPLTGKNFSGLVMKQDAADRWWVEAIELDAAALGWLVKNSDDYHCNPREKLKTIDPYGYAFKFSIDKIEAQDTIHTSIVNFIGTTPQGGKYELDLRLTQRAEGESP